MNQSPAQEFVCSAGTHSPVLEAFPFF